MPTAAAGDPRISACAGSRRGASILATVRAGGNGGGAAASGSAAGDDLYGAGMGVPAPLNQSTGGTLTDFAWHFAQNMCAIFCVNFQN